MTTMHIDILRSGEGKDGEYKVVEREHLPRWGQDTALTVVGKSHPRVEGEDKVTGRARYSYDMHLPGMLFCRVLRSANTLKS